MLLQMANFHSFIWLNTIPLYIRYILFIQSSVNGHLCCSQALAIVSSAVVNTGVLANPFQNQLFRLVFWQALYQWLKEIKDEKYTRLLMPRNPKFRYSFQCFIYLLLLLKDSLSTKSHTQNTYIVLNIQSCSRWEKAKTVQETQLPGHYPGIV